MNKFIISIVAALGLASVAHAEPVPDGQIDSGNIVAPSAKIASLTGNITASSDYRFRGVSQTKIGPEVSGNIDLVFKNGIYVGTFLSNVSSEYYAGGAGFEEDFYGGVKKSFHGVTFDVGSYTDTYYHASNDGISYTTSEAYVGASYGPLTVKGSHSFTNYFGIPNSHGSHYVTADLAQPVGPVTLIAHAAHAFVNHHNDFDYTDYNVGASYNLPQGWNITGLYYFNKNEGQGMKDYNTMDGHKLYGNNVVVALKKSF